MNNNLKVYKIEEEKLDKAAIKSSKILLIIFIFPVALAIFFAISFKTFSTLFLILLIFGGIIVISYPNRKKYLSLLRFEITDKYISQTIDHEGTNAFIEFGRARNRRNGSDDEKTILFKEIESVRIKKNGDMVITSVENNFLTNNHKIVIPAETEGYEELRDQIQKKSSKDL
jgi:hypothetical protein